MSVCLVSDDDDGALSDYERDTPRALPNPPSPDVLRRMYREPSQVSIIELNDPTPVSMLGLAVFLATNILSRVTVQPSGGYSPFDCHNKGLQQQNFTETAFDYGTSLPYTVPLYGDP